MPRWPLFTDTPRLLTVVLGLAAVTRGIAMAYFTAPNAPGLTVARGLAAVQIWGWSFITLGVILLGATAIHHRPLLRAAHVVAWSIYGMFASSLIFSSVFYGTSFASVPGLLITLGLHVTVSRSYRPAPRYAPRRRAGD